MCMTVIIIFVTNDVAVGSCAQHFNSFDCPDVINEDGFLHQGPNVGKL